MANVNIAPDRTRRKTLRLIAPTTPPDTSAAWKNLCRAMREAHQRNALDRLTRQLGPQCWCPRRAA